MLALLATLAAAAVAAIADDSALVAQVLTANSQVTKIMDFPVRIFFLVGWFGMGCLSYTCHRPTRNLSSTF
jgi:hypothetical protein